MATIINSPSGRSRGNGDSGATLLVVVVLVLFVAVLLFVYGYPAVRNAPTDARDQSNVQVPDKVNINVSAPTSGAEPQTQQ